MLPISTLVSDHLAATDHFTGVGPRDEVKGFESVLHDGENIVGWYQNPAPVDANIVFTDRALLFTQEGSTWRLSYRAISSWRPRNTDEGAMNGLDVQCDGHWFEVPFVGVHGDQGKARDAFRFAQILSRVIQAPREQLPA